MLQRVIFLFLAVVVPMGASADSYYGRFLDRLDVRIDASGVDDWNTITLLNDFRFDDPNGLLWTTPKGYEVNGASIPRWAWSIVGSPYTGRYLPASVIHDYYVVVQNRTAHDTHRNFYYGMLANGVSWAKAKTMYWAVWVYSDWDLEDPNERKALLASSFEANAGMAQAVKSVEQVFAEEAAGLRSGELAEPLFSIEDIEIDAEKFRKALDGSVAADTYVGFAAQNEFPLVLELVQNEQVEFDYFDLPEVDIHGFSTGFDEASLMKPYGVPYTMTLGQSVVTGDLSPWMKRMDADQMFYVDDNATVDPQEFSNVIEGLSAVKQAMALGNAPADTGVQVQVYTPGSDTGVLAIETLPGWQAETPSVKFVDTVEVWETIPNAALANVHKGGAIVTGGFTGDGSIRLKSHVGVNMYSDFGSLGFGN